MSASATFNWARERHGAFTVYYDPSKLFPPVLSALLSNPDRIFDSGQAIQSLWQNPATDKSVIELGGRSYFLKRYNCLGSGDRLKNIFRSSRAIKSWRSSWKFLEMGVPTPQPICCIEERRLRILGRSYLLYELLDEASSLLDAWLDLSQGQRVQVMNRVGAEVGRMHRLGLLHGDLNWRNILVSTSFRTVEIFFVDLDGSRCVRRLSRARAEKDLSHFFRDLQRNRAGDDETKLFVRAWEKMYLSHGPA